MCEKRSKRICCEVKTITKLSSPRPGFFLADQLYEKILEEISHARSQLLQTAERLSCDVTVCACVSNWIAHAVCLDQSEYQRIVDRLERDKLEGDDNFLESLKGIDGVLFVTKVGQHYLFLNDRGQDLVGDKTQPSGK